MGRPYWRVAWYKRSPGEPILGKVTVRQEIPTYPPPIIDPNDFSSDRYGGLGSTTEIEYFPGDRTGDVTETFRPDNDDLRGDPRPRVGPGIRVEAPPMETVSNQRRADVVRGIRHDAVYSSPIPGPGP